MAKFVTTNMVRVNFSAKPEFFELLPLAALLQNNEIDEELANIATNLLVVLAQTMTIEKYIPCAIEAIRKVAKCPSWSARALIADFLPIFVFYNMATINAQKSWVVEVSSFAIYILINFTNTKLLLTQEYRKQEFLFNMSTCWIQK